MSFILSKVLWLLVEPGNLLLLILIAGALLLFTRWRRSGVGIVLASTFLLTLIAVVPVGTYALHVLESRFPKPNRLPDHVDGIIVLGGGINPWLSHSHGIPQLNQHGERYTEAIGLTRRYPNARLVFTGGSGNLLDQAQKEAPVVRVFWESLGVDVSRVTFESESRNTWENAVRTKRVVEPKPGEVWILVTSAFHMPRSVGVFHRTGWQVVPYPVDFQVPSNFNLRIGFNLDGGMTQLNLAMKEVIGLVAYHLMGRTEALYPGPAAGQ